MNIQKNQTQESFEKLYVKNAPDWSLERDQDGGYKYHATQSAFLLFEQQQVEIDLLKAQLNNMESCYIEKKKQVDAVEHVLGCAMIGPKEVFMYAERIQEALQGGDQNTKNKAQSIENIGYEGGDQKAMIEAREQNR